MFIINDEILNELLKSVSINNIENIFNIARDDDRIILTVRNKIKNKLNLHLPTYSWYNLKKGSTEFIFAMSCILTTIFNIGDNYE